MTLFKRICQRSNKALDAICEFTAKQQSHLKVENDFDILYGMSPEIKVSRLRRHKWRIFLTFTFVYVGRTNGTVWSRGNCPSSTGRRDWESKPTQCRRLKRSWARQIIHLCTLWWNLLRSIQSHSTQTLWSGLCQWKWSEVPGLQRKITDCQRFGSPFGEQSRSVSMHEMFEILQHIAKVQQTSAISSEAHLRFLFTILRFEEKHAPASKDSCDW